MESAADIAWRYTTESVKSGHGFPEFSMDDLNIVCTFVNSRFSEDEQIILHVYDSIAREFIKGHRCSVCGMTTLQAKAANYNCSREC